MLSLANMTVFLSHGQNLKKLLLRDDVDATQPLHIGAPDIALLDFEHVFSMSLILVNKKVNKALFINLQHLYFDLIFCFFLAIEHILNGSKNISGNSGYDTHPGGVTQVTEHGIGFTTTCLAISHDC